MAWSSASRSVLLTAITSARPSSITRPATARSCFSSMSPASSTTTTTSARRMASSVSATEAASSRLSIRLRRRMPAVSTSRIGRPRHCHSTRIESRVMPASGPVSTRSSPTRRLSSVDLPTLGRPTMVSSIGRLARSASAFSPSSSSSIGAMWRARASCRSLSPSPCSAETGIGSPRPSPWASARPFWPARPSHLLATRITLAERLRSQLAKLSSSGRTPARASIRNRTTSEASTARSVKRRMRASSTSPPAVSQPAVSRSVKARSPSCAGASRISRVTPGWSSTSAWRRPTSRLNIVDLPTLGRPTMATLGVTRGGRLSSAEGNESA